MSDRTTIEWADATWNPVTGCRQVSPGCASCYARTFAERFRGVPGHYFEHGFDVQLRPDKLDQPLRWIRSRTIFTCSMSDLGLGAVPADYLAKVFAVMAVCPQHRFLVLSKHPTRLRAVLSRPGWLDQVTQEVTGLLPQVRSRAVADQVHQFQRAGQPLFAWPLPNVWIGTSAESQKWADVRIPALLSVPAVSRFLSAEPLLGRVTLCRCDGADYEVRRHPFLVNDGCPLHGRTRLDWVIAGGESGPRARPMHPDWARHLRDQCVVSQIPFLFKQWGAWTPTVAHPRAVRVSTAGDIEPPTASPAGCAPAQLMVRVGKGAAGRELDGRIWDQTPDGSAAERVGA